jgi:hypothetical protein
MSVMTVGQISSQKKTKDTVESVERISNRVPQLLHFTFLRRPALRNKTAKMPPARNTNQLNEPLNSTAGAKPLVAPQLGQCALADEDSIASCPRSGRESFIWNSFARDYVTIVVVVIHSRRCISRTTTH